MACLFCTIVAQALYVHLATEFTPYNISVQGIISNHSMFKARLDSHWTEIGYGHCERPTA